MCVSAGGLLLPETPNSLVERGLREEAREVLIKIRGTPNVHAELEDIVTAVKASQMVRMIPHYVCQLASMASGGR